MVSPFIPPDNPVVEKKDDFDYLEIPIFVDGKTNVIKLSYTFNSLGENNRYLDIYVPKYGNTGNEVSIYSEEFSSVSISRNISVDYSFPANVTEIPVHFVVREFRTIKTDVTYTVSKRTLGSVNIDTNPQCTINKGAVLYTRQDGLITMEERYDFENFFTSYSPQYSYLDISQLRFSYYGAVGTISKMRTLVYESVSLLIDDEENLFPDVGHFDPPIIRSFNLKLTLKKDGYYYVNWDQKLYVDPLTLKMSNTLKDGYVETPYFYFPRSIDYAKPLECLLFFRYLGVNNENFAIRFNVDKSTPVVGYCGVGSYCITSTSGTPNFEIGESVTYS